MRTKRIVAVVALAGVSFTGLVLSGCSMVTSAAPGSTTATGEAWYVRTGPMGGVRGIFYCTPGSAVCTEAEIR